jgi:hypothetical protein
MEGTAADPEDEPPPAELSAADGCARQSSSNARIRRSDSRFKLVGIAREVPPEGNQGSPKRKKKRQKGREHDDETTDDHYDASRKKKWMEKHFTVSWEGE